MKKLFHKWLCLLPLSMVVFSSCEQFCIQGEGPVISEKRDLKSFNSVRLKISGDIIFEQSDTTEFIIEAQKNIIDNITTNIVDNTLNIEHKECIGVNKGITFRIKIPEVKKLIISGSGKIVSKGVIKGEHLELGINGSGLIELGVDAESVYSGIRGSGQINIKGNAKEQFIKLTGSGNYIATDLASIKTDAEILGSGRIDVCVLEKLKAKIKGSGEINYKGSPKTSISIDGSGSVNKKE